ncbi:hypothetical protein C8046_13875 [Serinibacter arcticus]|uniref:ANTAR domain-containing protein n=1 Tax=Serinibacter arcticus TaxID=1655435 RepID=A0A2U1ZX59_9MICO|nr:GAF and ANTAR domain-containing protein [Serinibacter arcticus]PWD51568.1 hypothetical protein C8046_13875 [Serinibacter arcticus]
MSSPEVERPRGDRAGNRRTPTWADADVERVLATEGSEVAWQMAHLVSELDEVDDVAAALQLVTSTALSVVDGAEFAGVTVRGPGKELETAAPTSPLVLTADALQYDLQEGPCVDAVRGQFMIVAHDVATDPRWPAWSSAVSGTVGSVLSVRLVSARGNHGGINLYSSRPHAYSTQSQLAAALLAAHAGVAIRSILLEQDLRDGLAGRLVIGQAQGILMHRFGIDEHAAFAVLRRLSNNLNQKVARVAADLVAEPGKDLAAG